MIQTQPTAKLKATLNKSFRHILKPRPKISGSEWANNNFVLSAETATTPGAYNWKRAPYQKEWLDVICDDHTQKVVLMTAARVGKSVSLKAATGFYMSNDPASIMWLLPTLTLAGEFSATEIDPMIRDVRVIRELVRDKRTRDSGNNKLTKRYKGGVLHLVGAESANGLHGKTIRVLFADEVDRFPVSSGKDGDPLTLASVRTTTFQHRRKVVYSSTPTYKDLSVIEREFLASDQRYYHVPCPDCGHFQVLRWKNLDYKDNPTSPEYVCESCGVLIPEYKKMGMLLAGKWIATNANSSVVGFHLSALYSVHMSWRELVEEWQAAKGNRFKLQVFINSRLGETWDDSGERVSHHQLRQRLETYNAAVPTKDDHCAGVGILSAGVDIQGNRIECSVYAHGPNDDVYFIDTQIFDGDTGKDAVWNLCANYLLTTRFSTKHGGSVGIRAIAVDAGYQTERVYRFVRQLKERDTANRSIIATRGQEKFPRIISDRPSNSKEHNSLYYPIGTNIAKEHLMKLLLNTEGNRIHLPAQLPSVDNQSRWMDDEVLQQLTSERQVLTYVGGKATRVWKKTRERNEQWDMLILAYAAMLHLGPNIRNDLPLLTQKVSELQGSGVPLVASPTQSMSPPPTAVRQVAPGIRLHASRTSLTNDNIWKR